MSENRTPNVCQNCGRPASGYEFEASGLCQRCLNGPLPAIFASVAEKSEPPPLTAYTCPRWHRDADGWCIDERPHLAARPSAYAETRVLGVAAELDREAERGNPLLSELRRETASRIRAALDGTP